MVSECKDYEKKGYCIRAKECPFKHSEEPIQLDVSGYRALIEAMNAASAKAAALSKEQQNELKRKKTDLLNNLISQQRSLIRKIEQCTDESERIRLKTALDEMSQKTKDWIEQEGATRSGGLKRSTASSNVQAELPKS